LSKWLISVQQWRDRRRAFGIDELRRMYGMPRAKHYQNAVDQVVKLITDLAPEAIQDLNDNWRRQMKLIEANQRIEQQEKLGESRSIKDWLDYQPPTSKEP
jgi:hypothetical protein